MRHALIGGWNLDEVNVRNKKLQKSLHLEIKNMLRTFLGLKLKKTKNNQRLSSVLMFL